MGDLDAVRKEIGSLDELLADAAAAMDAAAAGGGGGEAARAEAAQLRAMADGERRAAVAKAGELEERATALALPRDSADTGNCILEVRSV
jgi:protein subunit release factor A